MLGCLSLPDTARTQLSVQSCAAAVLLGPLQSCTFLLNQGLLAATLGAFWSAQANWVVSVPVAALVRVAGTLAYIMLSSWTMNENLFALLMSNVYALLVSLSSSSSLPSLSSDNEKSAAMRLEAFDLDSHAAPQCKEALQALNAYACKSC